MAKNAVCTWDFTIPQKSISQEELSKALKDKCKQWTYQLEKGTKSNYLHYQGRVSLKLKARKGPEICKGIRWSPTSDANKDNDFYVNKDETREEGPWCDKDKEIYIPRQYRNIKPYKWQMEVLESRNVFQDRVIDLIYDPIGNKGKSTVSALGELLYDALDCPPINDCKELIQFVCNHCMDNEIRKLGLLFVDLPRAMNKDSLYGIYSAIEQIKKGKVTDTRHHAKAWWIDSPRIWVFSNHLPDPTLLSSDRWNIWTINKENDKLERYIENNKAGFFEADKSCNNTKKRLFK